MLYTNRGSTMTQALQDALGQAASARMLSAYVGPDACESLSLRERGKRIPIRLVVGRALSDGVPPQTLGYLRNLEPSLAQGGGGIRVADPSFHSKVYCFDLRNGGRTAWVGSSNLSGHGLGDWIEANVVAADERTLQAIVDEAERAWVSGVSILSDRVPVVQRPPPAQKDRPRRREHVEDRLPVEPGVDGIPGLRITLVDPATGDVQRASGLNWAFGAQGKRPRNPDEAMVALRVAQLDAAADVFGSAHRGTRFQAITHDGREMEMKLAGGPPDKPKNISSARDEKIFGKWILRQMLQLPEWTRATRAHLDAYGRTDIGFYRIGTDPATGQAIVYMDFRP